MFHNYYLKNKYKIIIFKKNKIKIDLIYINDAVKVRYHILHIGEKSLQEQFFTLSDSAKYILTDPLWQQTWNVRGDLEYSLLSQNPDKFITQLFGILDQFDIKYSANREYCHRSIDYLNLLVQMPLTT